jgi:tRNA (guanine37-N1)-methyltransferase
MRFDIITIFPTIFDSYFHEGMIRKGTEQKLLDIHIHNLRDYSTDKWKKVDDIPFGGGAGMVMTPQPLVDAIKAIKEHNSGPVIYLSPKGTTLTHTKAKRWASEWQKPYIYNRQENTAAGDSRRAAIIVAAAKSAETASDQQKKEFKASKSAKPGAILICGRYEGIDQRVIDLCVDLQISIGKYILTGGELAAMVLIDSVSRFVPGVLGDENSHQEETFSRKLKGKKEYPHYTKPRNFAGLEVPEVLLSGNHAKIDKWRQDHLS